MQLSVREAARLLNVSEKTVYRWIERGDLAAHKVNEQPRLNRAELLEWATARRMGVSAELFQAEAAAKAPAASLAAALEVGGVHYRLPGVGKVGVLESVVAAMPLPEEVDRQFLLQLLVSRESMGSTGLGNGIAVPHVRNPIVMHVERPLVMLCFLEQPVDFAAVDGLPVHTLFAIVAPTIKAHLSLLSRLAFALRQPVFAAAVAERADCTTIMSAARQVD